MSGSPNGAVAGATRQSGLRRRQGQVDIFGHHWQSHAIYREVGMATKDKNTKKSMEKKPAQKTLKEKRQAKRAKS